MIKSGLMIVGVQLLLYSYFFNGLWAQKHDYNWCFSHELRIDFNDNPVSVKKIGLSLGRFDCL
jgi:hypothetical protein